MGNQTIGTAAPPGVPLGYSKQTSNARSFTIQKGQLNKYRLRPQVLNEHAESSREVQGVVDASTIVGQVFKASQDNINGIMMTLESAAAVVLDDFESYADSAALQAQWIESNATFKALLDTTIVASGKSMNLPMDAVIDDEWIDTIGSTDYTDYTFDFNYLQTPLLVTAGIAFFLGDGTNTSSIDINIQDPLAWEHFEIDVNALSVQSHDATANPVDLTAVTEIGFRLYNRTGIGEAYIDDLSVTPPPGQVELKLWDMGDELPGSVSLDSGTQYTELGDRGLNSGVVASSVLLELDGGKRLYDIRQFVAGPALEIPSNTILIPGNYYAITLHYVDTDVNVFGPDTSYNKNYYVSGYAFTAPDESTGISAIGAYSDLMFGIYSTQDVYINTVVKEYDAEPGNIAVEYIFIEDTDMKVSDIITNNATPVRAIQAEFKDRTFYLMKGGKFEIYHNDDFTDSTSVISVLMGYIYKPPTVNG